MEFSINSEPSSCKEVILNDVWKYAIKNYYCALINNGIWKLVGPSYGTKPRGYMWVCKNKYKSNNSLDKHKAMFMAKILHRKKILSMKR